MSFKIRIFSKFTTVFSKKPLIFQHIFNTIAKMSLFNKEDSRIKKCILKIVTKNKELVLTTIQASSGSPQYVVEQTGISRSNVQKYLRELLDEGYLEKVGRPPAVYYKVIDNFSRVVHENFVFKDTVGYIFRGLQGLEKWTENKYTDKTLTEKIQIYEESFRLYKETRKKNGLFEISAGLESLKTHTDIYVDRLFCIDLYNTKVEVHTKRTKSAVWLEAAKNPNSKRADEFATKLCNISIGAILTYSKEKNIQSAAFVPPTAKRKVQIMKKLEISIKEKCPFIDYLKIKRYDPSGLLQEQKTIGTVRGRIENASLTFDLISKQKWDTVLLIDDLVGSAATLNEIARKIKQKKIAKTVHAITIVGVNSKKFPIVKKI